MNQITERLDREATTGAASDLGARFSALLPAGAGRCSPSASACPTAARPTPRRSVGDLVLR